MALCQAELQREGKGEALWVKINRPKHMHTAQTRSLGEPGVSCFPLLPTDVSHKFSEILWSCSRQRGLFKCVFWEQANWIAQPYFHLICLVHTCSPTSQPSVVMGSLWSITHHLGDEYVSRAWCNSTHQRGMFEKHTQLLEFSGRSTVAMNICWELCYLLTQQAEVPCTLHTNFSFIQ